MANVTGYDPWWFALVTYPGYILTLDIPGYLPRLLTLVTYPGYPSYLPWLPRLLSLVTYLGYRLPKLHLGHRPASWASASSVLSFCKAMRCRACVAPLQGHGIPLDTQWVGAGPAIGKLNNLPNIQLEENIFTPTRLNSKLWALMIVKNDWQL